MIPSKAELENKLKINFGKRVTVEVKEDIFFRMFGIDMIIPKGLESDGASLPNLASLFIDRFDERIIFHSIVHDYNYRTQFLPRLLSDALYAVGLKQEAGPFIAILFYHALRRVGFFAWNGNKKKGLDRFPEAKERLRRHICRKLKD